MPINKQQEVHSLLKKIYFHIFIIHSRHKQNPYYIYQILTEDDYNDTRRGQWKCLLFTSLAATPYGCSSHGTHDMKFWHCLSLAAYAATLSSYFTGESISGDSSAPKVKFMNFHFLILYPSWDRLCCQIG